MPANPDDSVMAQNQYFALLSFFAPIDSVPTDVK
jgi:hypothetical protein